ncbi:MAG: GNAT family N-acetyltransferase [Acidimicrobiaceae bacterium]|nr:GNAT family N-acetyltransferase [Acidimicrobiaceae bacterium]
MQELCQLAARKYGLQKLSAAVAIENIASRKVLAKSGFIPDGPRSPVSPRDLVSANPNQRLK